MNPALLDQLLDAVADRVEERLRAQPDMQTKDADGSPWMSINTAADYLDWPRQRLYKLTAQNAIPHYKHDGRLLFNRQELDRWVREHAQHRLDVPDIQSYQSDAL